MIRSGVIGLAIAIILMLPTITSSVQGGLIPLDDVDVKHGVFEGSPRAGDLKVMVGSYDGAGWRYVDGLTLRPPAGCVPLD